MNSKIELYASICSVLERPEAKKEIWDILAGYTVNALAAYSSLENSIKEFLNAKRADSLSEKSIFFQKYPSPIKWEKAAGTMRFVLTLRFWELRKGFRKGSGQTEAHPSCFKRIPQW